jgi:hypothetical protein
MFAGIDEGIDFLFNDKACFRTPTGDLMPHPSCGAINTFVEGIMPLLPDARKHISLSLLADELEGSRFLKVPAEHKEHQAKNPDSTTGKVFGLLLHTYGTIMKTTAATEEQAATMAMSVPATVTTIHSDESNMRWSASSVIKKINK